MVRRVPDENGREYRVVALSTFLTVIGLLATVAGSLVSWFAGASHEQDRLFEKLDQRYQSRAAAEAIHNYLSERITYNAGETDKVEGKLEVLRNRVDSLADGRWRPR